ncbi:PAS domain-containing sensor histidine kinase [Hymenobacter psychrophilus]|uniref:histidine kinase n=1 Tax=Hymenobacter psychrophilus TaxID=651662 RepID=A0A1H3LRI5_9BACT|nr:PAS domain-containing protein [Hymenobacter psychrophilus]SDY66973.1 PAS domain S-box-containing protein [Hymenobacter psychrophilus]
MSAPASSFSDLNPAGLAEVLLTTSLNGTLLLRPLYAADGQELVDFAWERLNPAAQQMLNLPERPTASFLTLFPTAQQTGVFGFYRDAFQSGQLAQRQNLYQYDGLDAYYILQAQRYEGVLVVSFADGNEQSRTRVEKALRESQARERAARAAAERQQGELKRVFEQAPVAIAVYRGPQYIIELANPTVCRLWGRTPEQIIGKGLFEALPEVAGMGYEQLLDGVMATGKPYVAHAMPAVHERDGRRDTVYWDFVYVAMYEADGSIYGAMVVATEVTEQVLARQQVQQLNEELEVRVRARTAEAHAALREAQDQREQQQEQQNLLRQILRQVPASVATLMGPEHHFAFFNHRYYTLTGNRAALGRKVADVLPELMEQGFLSLLDRVYATGEAFSDQEISIVLEQPTGPASQQYIDFSYQPLTDRQGQVQGILVFILDTTEQVRARRQADTLQAAALAAVQRRAQQRQELYQIFAQTPVAIVLLREPDHRIDYFNPAFEELFPPEEWAGRDMQGHVLAEVYPRIKLAGLVELLDRVFETGEPQAVLDMPLANLYPGSPRYVTFTYQAYREEGRIVGVAAFAYDVTEQVVSRRDAEIMQAALLASAQRSAEERQELLALFEQAPVAVALLREPDHRIEYFNTAFAELYPTQNILGRPVVEVYPGMASPDVIGRLDRVYTTGETYQGLEQPLRTAAPGGKPRYITFTYQAYREHERIAGVAVFIHEVTEQVLAREAREAQQQLVEAVFEQSPTAIWVAEGPDYVFSIVNPLMEQILGRTQQQLIGKPYFEVMTELTSQGLPELMRQVWESGETLSVKEMPARLNYHQPDEVGYFSLVFQPLRDEAQGEVIGIACVAVEVTDQVRARQQVQQLNQEMQLTNAELHDTNARLIRTNTDLDTFVYTASHDLKAPISNIEGLLLALRQQLPPEALEAPLVPRLFSMMEDSVMRFQQTIGHLTDISQLQQAEAPETIDLSDLVAGVRLDLAPLIEAASVALSVTVEDCQAVRVAPKTLRSVVYNLLSNAVKYRAPDRPAQVQLRAHCTPTQLVLAVQDNGLGLNTAQQAELFGMFRRLHVHVEGSGVGLFMVKRLVENAGGTITVESQPGVGSTFTVLLPA